MPPDTHVQISAASDLEQQQREASKNSKQGWSYQVVTVIVIGLVCASSVMLLVFTDSPIHPRVYKIFRGNSSDYYNPFWKSADLEICKEGAQANSSCVTKQANQVFGAPPAPAPSIPPPHPPGYDQWLKFAEDNHCHTGRYLRIEKDLEAFRDPKSGKLRILKQHVEGAKKMLATAVFNVTGGKLDIQGDNVPGLDVHGGVKRMMSRYVHQLPDLEFVVNINDQPRVIPGSSPNRDERFASSLCENACESFQKYRHLHGYVNNRRPYPEDQPTSELVALFSQAKISECHRDIMFPSVYTFNNRMWPGEQAQLRDWSNRDGIMFFRGSTTGGIFNNMSTYNISHRQRLVKKVQGNPDYDIQFSDIIQCEEEVCKAMDAEYGHVARVPEMHNFHHKYLMSVDGNSFVARLSKFLQSGSLIFRAGMFDEWYEEWLHEGVNYVRVALDYSDLAEKLQWAKDNDEAARKIGEQGRITGDSRTRVQDMECYLYRLLLEYAAIVEK